MKTGAKISRLGSSHGNSLNRDTSFWFSDDITHWIHSKVRSANRRIAEQEREYRAKKKRENNFPESL